MSRRYVNDSATFDNALLGPLRKDVIQYTWLHER